jgi:hypothetical protein
VRAALNLSELSSSTPTRLGDMTDELERVGIVLTVRADLVEGFDIDIELLADDLSISEDDASAAIAALRDPADDGSDDTALLDAVGQDNDLFNALPTTIRDIVPGLPPLFENEEVDAAIARFDANLLPAIFRGEEIDPSTLTDQQRDDLEVVTAALGGDEQTVSVTKREKYRARPGRRRVPDRDRRRADHRHRPGNDAAVHRLPGREGGVCQRHGGRRWNPHR